MRLVLAAIALLAANPLHALSCLKPDPVSRYLEAVEATEGYFIVVGEISYARTPPERPDSAAFEERPDVTIQAKIEGQALGKQGFERAFKRDLDLVSTCIGPWCGQFPQQGPLLAFVRAAEPQPVLEMSACPHNTFLPAPENLARIEACHLRGKCEPAQ
ncbi:MAG: hypothetical protein AAFV38_03020 [Pseudomonadota bacterium]